MKRDYKLRDPEEWEKRLCMPVKEFLNRCYMGEIGNSDGFGYFGTAKVITDIKITPSTLLLMEKMEIIPSNFTHIWWYNC